MKYLNRVGVALSILINVILGGASNQTFSARNWQWKKDERPNLVWLFDLTLGKDHCASSWINWQIRRPH